MTALPHNEAREQTERERTRIGDYELSDSERHTRDGRFRIDPRGAKAIITDTRYVRQMLHPTTAFYCIAWRNGYNAAREPGKEPS